MWKNASVKDRILSVIILFLVCALAVCSYFLTAKQREFTQTDAKLKAGYSELESAKSELDGYRSKSDEYSSQIEEDKKKQDELSSQLDAAIKEKERLEKENSELKAQLTAKKKAQQNETARLAISKSQQSTAQDGGKICYLTFDDGPTANTLKILDILKSYNVKATFFVIGCTGHIDYVKNIAAEGHTIGLHSFTHNYADTYASVDGYFADLKKISDAVESLTGIKSTIVRFPGGSSNAVSKQYCKGIMTRLTSEVPSRGYSYFDWNVSSGDATSNKPAKNYIINSVLTGAKGKTSICVLMHDAAAKTTTVEALPAIIEGLYNMGYTFQPLTPQTYGFHHGVNN